MKTKLISGASYMCTGLGLNTLRLANLDRLPQFRNGKGELAHIVSNGSDWSLGEWMCALTGEVGEAANIIKKIQRGDISLTDARDSLAKEYADILIYLDMLAFQTGVNLSHATIEKFNEVSIRVGATARIGE